MIKNNGFRKTICLATILSLTAMLAGCGGGDDKKKNQDRCTDNILFLFFCVLPSSVDTTGSNDASSLAAVAEYEPNNVLNNANIVSLPAGSQLKGSVSSIDDASDFYIFTPTRSGTHTILLCGETCDTGVEDDAAYIMIYDQNQTTIASTPIGTIANQEITAELTAGFAYYVEVNGYNAGAFNYDYRLAVLN